MTDKEPPLILDKGEVACAPKKDPEHYEGENAKLPKKYTIQEVRQRQALKEYGNQIAGDTFKEGEDFKGYFSDQWESPLQQKLLQRVTTDYVDLHEQEELFKCELKPLDVEMDIMDGMFLQFIVNFKFISYIFSLLQPFIICNCCFFFCFMIS